VVIPLFMGVWVRVVRIAFTVITPLAGAYIGTICNPGMYEYTTSSPHDSHSFIN
jgi:hypothetical protein